MRHDSRAYLWDVREATDAILRFLAGIDFATYASTEMLYSAVERKFEIIGEAFNQLSKADPALATRIPDLDRIVAFRNLLIPRLCRSGSSPSLAHRSGIPTRVARYGCDPARRTGTGRLNTPDYRIHSDREKAIITGGSTFNIKAKSLRLGNFVQEEVAKLYHQHTDETGQIFTVDALTRVWDLTQGQPWLVNALGYEACFRLKAGRDRQ